MNEINAVQTRVAWYLNFTRFLFVRYQCPDKFGEEMSSLMARFSCFYQ
jgi:hypothetical protein